MLYKIFLNNMAAQSMKSEISNQLSLFSTVIVSRNYLVFTSTVQTLPQMHMINRNSS